jgi:uncharacterized protein DUF4153
VTGGSGDSHVPRGEPSQGTRLGLGILVAGAAVGILGDGLLRAVPWGVNATLCIWALVAGGIALVRWQRLTVSPDAPWLALTALLLGAAFLRRDSEWLQFFNLVALGGVLALGALATRGTALRGASVLDYAGAALIAAVHAGLGALKLVFGDIQWAEMPATGRLRVVRSVGLGALIATPLLVVFGTLFASADPVFAGVLENVLAIEPEEVMGHLALMGFFGWISVGYFTGALLPFPAARTLVLKPPAGVSLGIAPAATALALVNLLFLVFVVVQLRYLFGGGTFVFETTGLTLAEYARSGFFELVTVSGLVLPLLLGADGLLRDADAAGRRVFRWLAGLLLVLLAIVMVSALERMRLYVGEFGLSEDRLYATAFMGYLAILFAWFSWTVLRERRGRFAFGGVVQGLSVLAGLHILNPDALIARVNLDRTAESQRFDAPYLTTQLGADAVPVLLERLPDLPPARACDVARGILHRWTEHDSGDWRSWNWARARARRLVYEQRAELKAKAAPCTRRPQASGRPRR